MPSQDTRSEGHAQQGFTLIEVLIAIVLLAIGMLSMAQMQANGIRANHGAYLRSQATILAGDILDSMRANAPAARAGGYNVALANTGASGTIAGDDVIAWKTALADLLPSGDGSISNVGNTLTVTVQWADSRQNETATTRIFRVDSTL